MRVFVVFFVLTILFVLWRFASADQRKAALKAIRPFVVPVLLGGGATPLVSVQKQFSTGRRYAAHFRSNS